jgi:peptide deformylase
MTSDEKIHRVAIASLLVVKYPDPRLRELCTPIAAVDDAVRALAERMLELMFAARGVGLAAPQVGVTVRMFVASPTYESGDRRVYINPEIISGEGTQDSEEGCLSFPNVSCKIKRKKTVTIRAVDRAGQPFEETGEDFVARIFQHECDHLDGRLLIDRMGSVAKLANRKVIQDLEEEFVAV